MLNAATKATLFSSKSSFWQSKNLIHGSMIFLYIVAIEMFHDKRFWLGALYSKIVITVSALIHSISLFKSTFEQNVKIFRSVSQKLQSNTPTTMKRKENITIANHHNTNVWCWESCYKHFVKWWMNCMDKKWFDENSIDTDNEIKYIENQIEFVIYLVLIEYGLLSFIKETFTIFCDILIKFAHYIENEIGACLMLSWFSWNKTITVGENRFGGYGYSADDHDDDDDHELDGSDDNYNYNYNYNIKSNIDISCRQYAAWIPIFIIGVCFIMFILICYVWLPGLHSTYFYIIITFGFGYFLLECLQYFCYIYNYYEYSTISFYHNDNIIIPYFMVKWSISFPLVAAYICYDFNQGIIIYSIQSIFVLIALFNLFGMMNLVKLEHCIKCEICFSIIGCLITGPLLLIIGLIFGYFYQAYSFPSSKVTMTSLSIGEEQNNFLVHQIISMSYWLFNIRGILFVLCVFLINVIIGRDLYHWSENARPAASVFRLFRETWSVLQPSLIFACVGPIFGCYFGILDETNKMDVFWLAVDIITVKSLHHEIKYFRREYLRKIRHFSVKHQDNRMIQAFKTHVYGCKQFKIVEKLLVKQTILRCFLGCNIDICAIILRFASE